MLEVASISVIFFFMSGSFFQWNYQQQSNWTYNSSLAYYTPVFQYPEGFLMGSIYAEITSDTIFEHTFTSENDDSAYRKPALVDADYASVRAFISSFAIR